MQAQGTEAGIPRLHSSFLLTPSRARQYFLLSLIGPTNSNAQVVVGTEARIMPGVNAN
jgi:hypothetical protein